VAILLGVKVFISSDMEGTSGVVDWSQVRPGPGDYEYYRQLLQAEVNAAILGAADAGASEFLVNDSHSTMQNLRPDGLAGNARYLSGRHKPLYMMQGLDASFDAIFFVSYHGSMAAAAPLSHTYNPRAIASVTLNGTVVGEAGINALVALAHGVPVVLVTGDDVTVRETQAICPGVHGAVVKTAVSRFAADSLHPSVACELIRERARDAVAGLATAAPPPITLPATLDVTYRNADIAELATWIDGVVRTGPTAVRIAGDDPLRVFRSFIATVLLTRDVAE
jgi:D-amino peptidase